MKRILSFTAIILCICITFCSCNLNFGAKTIDLTGNSDSAEIDNEEEQENQTSSKKGENKNKKKTTSNSSKEDQGSDSKAPSSKTYPAVGGGGSQCAVIPGGSSLRNRGAFKVPANLMTTAEYHSEIEKLAKSATSFTDASKDFLNKLDALDIKLQQQIVYNTDDITKCSGTRYYVAENGNDNNDGKSPERPWKTIKKVNSATLKNGDLVSFRRNDTFRGIIDVKSGVSYGAYGSGYKPQILGAFDGKQWKWVKTDKANVWKLDHQFGGSDATDFPSNDPNKLLLDLTVAVAVKKDGSEIVCSRSSSISSLKKDGAFCYCGPNYKGSSDNGKSSDYHMYMYCSGNPNDIYTDIEIGVNLSVFNEGNRYIQNVHLNNLEILYGRGPFWPGDCKNISVTYCIAGWQGGFDDGSQGVAYGGGGGVWGSCDSFVWDHCYIFQQWDSGVSPQYKGTSDPVVTYKDFITTNCLFKGCKWTLEYWLYQKKTTKDIIDHLVFDYNLCRDGGYGFNNYMRSESAYVQTWGYESSCYNSSISHNLFDRPYRKTYEIGGFEQITAGTDSISPVDKFSVERMPKMEGNIHLHAADKPFALIHKGCEYKNSSHDLELSYNKNDIQKMIDAGIEKNSLYLFASR